MPGFGIKDALALEEVLATVNGTEGCKESKVEGQGRRPAGDAGLYGTLSGWPRSRSRYVSLLVYFPISVSLWLTIASESKEKKVGISFVTASGGEQGRP